MKRNLLSVAFVVILIVLVGCGESSGSSRTGSSGGTGGIVGGYTPPEPLIITTVSLPSAIEEQWYSTFVNCKGGVSPYTMTCAGLPSGLGYAKTDTGIRISGTPKAGCGGTYTVLISVQDSSKQSASMTYSLEVMTASSGTLQIRTTALPPFVEKEWQEVLVYASGGNTPYSWNCSGLPSGLNFGVASNAMRIFGTPASGTAGKSYTVSVTVKDSSSPSTSDSKSLILQVVVAGSATPLSITTTALPSAREGTAYEAYVEATGGMLPYSWECEGLPTGLTTQVSNSKLRIFGTPASGSNGSYDVLVVARDSSNPQKTSEKVLKLNVEVPPPPEPLVISTQSLTQGKEGASYETYVEATGGVLPYSWNCEGLPAGLLYQVSNNKLRICGTPDIGTGNSSYDVTVVVKDASAQEAAKTYTLYVEEKGAAPSIPLPYDPSPTDTPLKWAIYVRVCPDGDVNFMERLGNRIRTASQNLWNMSNGQMYIARAHISDNWGWGPNGDEERGGNRDMYYRWAREEGVTYIIENLDKWYVRYIGMAAGYAGDWGYSGIFIVMGGGEGWWSAPVLTHEWGHAKLKLYDEHGSEGDCDICVMYSGLGTANCMRWCWSQNCLSTQKIGWCWEKITDHFTNIKMAPTADHTKTVPGCPDTFIEIVDR